MEKNNKEKGLKINYWPRNIILLLIYWFISTGIPFIIVGGLANNNRSYNSKLLLILSILFIAPILFYFIFKQAKFNSKSGKVAFIIMGLIMPYLFVYIYTFVVFASNFGGIIM
jgi:membrane protease YdiL (CAAX protease family)